MPVAALGSRSAGAQKRYRARAYDIAILVAQQAKQHKLPASGAAMPIASSWLGY